MTTLTIDIPAACKPLEQPSRYKARLSWFGCRHPGWERGSDM